MADLALDVKDVHKYYEIGQGKKASYDTLRDRISEVVSNSFLRIVGSIESGSSSIGEDHDGDETHIWALRGVSFQVKPGEVIGIIGPNGAGKSTLLKILSRITEPTKGSIDIFGRVGSLLEVGTGFHKELTGRENVYLNGAILGMKNAEINQKFDQIVDFSGVEKFLDTPLKYYSSGMSVRLAFSVAAHLDPEILLVDEVLAVGDAAFQKKCLNKMEEVGKQGRTVLFVSHHMPSITRLCERVLLLENGMMIQDGSAHQVVGEYLRESLETSHLRIWSDSSQAPGNDIVRLSAVRVKSEIGEGTDVVDIRQPVGIEIEFDVLKPGYSLYPGFTVHNEEGLWLFASLDTDPSWRKRIRPVGHYVSTGWIPGNFLAEGTMIIGVSIRSEEPRNMHFYERDIVAFQVIEKAGDLTSRVDFVGDFPGVIRPLLKWETHFSSSI
jgi:lipopolysaccharide transport system ATP-binding protein